MPKKLDNIREKAIACTREVLETQGYPMLAMRDIASKCGVAVGTMYNYFPSKEYLTGCVVLEDWKIVYEQMTSAATGAGCIGKGLQQIYELMCGFVMSHQYLTTFDRRQATGEYDFDQRHLVLLRQIEVLVEMLQKRFGYPVDAAITTFLAESILNFSVKKYPYSQIAPGFMKLLR